MELADFLAMTSDELMRRVDEVPLRCLKYLAMWYPEARVRRELLRRLGVRFVDDSSFANMGFCVTPNSPSDVGVRIGRHVSIGPNVTCVCDSCANNGDEINGYRYVAERLTRRQDIVIEDEAWIGANATLLPGVRVGRCCVVGAGAVVTGDAEDYGIYAGVPARKVGDVRAWEGEDHGE